ncbi:MAG: hypothetical protein ACLFVU_03455, partial [Phycisphaerae bacterium]
CFVPAASCRVVGLLTHHVYTMHVCGKGQSDIPFRWRVGRPANLLRGCFVPAASCRVVGLLTHHVSTPTDAAR